MTTTTFFGIPVEAESIHKGRRGRVAQEPVEKFHAALMRLFADAPQVEAVHWEQYTPYFNDGDTCEFGISEVRFKFAGIDEENEDYEDEFHYGRNSHADSPLAPLLGVCHWEGSWQDGTRKLVTEGGDPKLIAALEAFDLGLQYENALYEAFGDHASVTVRRDKITVDSYEHD